jgi:mannose-6-phosphate isomerase-like protein (cupin superfamily)
MKGYTANIEKLAIENGNFRKVLYTCTNCQLVLMSLLPEQEIGEEVHDVDQFFRIEKGQGTAIINGESHEISDGSAVVIPAGAKHNIINRGNEPLKLYSLYMPPHHKDGVVHTTKEIGEADTTDVFDGTTTELLK